MRVGQIEFNQGVHTIIGEPVGKRQYTMYEVCIGGYQFIVDPVNELIPTEIGIVTFGHVD